MLLTYTIAFGLAWWLGLYLLGRGPRRALLLRSGLGLLAYALALLCAALQAGAPDARIAQLQSALTFLPALCWAGALILLAPVGEPLRRRADQLWGRVAAPLCLAALALAAADGAPLPPAPGAAPGRALLLMGLFVLPLVAALALNVYGWRAARPTGALALAAAAALFFSLALALLAVPLGAEASPWALIGLGVDLGLLGLAIARADAFEQGEALAPDMLRSLIAAGLSAASFGALVAASGAGAWPLLAVVALAIATQTLADPIQSLLDRLAFPREGALRQARAELRESASALPRVEASEPLAELDEAAFTRLVRRALSSLGDLGRLAESPLAQLPAVGARIAARGAPDQPLERAAELKALLAESIARLKPPEGEFGTSDAWRHYNALYFPYVVGLRPYSRRGAPDELSPAARRAQEWLATQVPERTLHNWQSAAARIVAADLRAGLR